MSTTEPHAAALLAEARRYLETHDVVTLATVDDAGVWAAPVLYASDDRLDLCFLSDPGTRHCVAIQRHAWVSAAVHDTGRGWRELSGVQLRGRAALAREEDLGASFQRYADKFPYAPGLLRHGDPYRFYRLRPTWLRLVDNGRGLGARRELFPSREARRPA